MALVQLTNALKLVIVEKVHVHSGTAAALATRPLHERGLGKHERSIGTLKQNNGAQDHVNNPKLNELRKIARNVVAMRARAEAKPEDEKSYHNDSQLYLFSNYVLLK